jgi:hypothetical protein
VNRAISSEARSGRGVRVDIGWCQENVKKALTLAWASVFLAKTGAARYQVRAFSAVAGRSQWFAAIAQLVEHVIRNDGVTGSNPVCGTILSEAALRSPPPASGLKITR